MLSQKYFHLVSAFLMGLIMSFIISGVLAYINLGLIDGFMLIWFKGWMKAFVVAYPCILVIAPLARNLAKKICSK